MDPDFGSGFTMAHKHLSSIIPFFGLRENAKFVERLGVYMKLDNIFL